MSLKVLYKTDNVRFVFSLGKRQLIAALAVVLGLTFIAGRSTSPDPDTISTIAYTQSGLIEQQQEVERLKLATQQQLTGMVIKLGDMQGQIRRLDALGGRLAEQSGLAIDEFGFGQELAVGGPSHEVVDFLVEDSTGIIADIQSMLATLEDKANQLDALETILMSHHVDAQSYLAGRPVQSGWLSSYYGIRKDPFNGLPAMHKGLDFAGKIGDPVVATGAGLVTWAGERYGYGNLVEVDHGDGFSTRYGHNKEVTVKVGDVVTKGQKVGLMGKTGRATGAHVHYEVLKHGKQQDPLAFVYRKSRKG
ncbi:M23 family metallopeptidase [Alteromonadaceae bacterium BrNp21-10]|nr:M23 family metallopeptidase [Alteromonadaceae bacterium BrNp21-10]